MQRWLAEAYLRRGQQQSSAADLERAIELQPDDGRALKALVAMLLQAGDLQGARRAVARHGAGQPDVAEVLTAYEGRLPRAHRDRHLTLLSALFAGDELPAARQWPAPLRPLGAAAAALLAKNSPASAPRPRDARVSVLSALFATAAALEAGEDPRPAVAELAPSEVPELRSLERCVVRRAAADLLLRGAAEPAEELLRRFPMLFEESERAALSVRIGDLHFAAGRYREAAAAFRAAAGTYAMEQPIAIACEAAGDEAQATQRWMRVLSREERQLEVGRRADLGKVHLHVARLAWREDQYQSAATHFERGLKLGEPEDPEVLAEYADCLDNLGRRDAALRVYLQYFLRVPRDRDTISWLIEDRIFEGEHDGALEIIESLPECEAGVVGEACQRALAVIVIRGLLFEDRAEWVRRASAQLSRVPGASVLGDRVGAIVAAREGRMDEALVLLDDAEPVPEDDGILSKWAHLVEGAARLRVGRSEDARTSFGHVLEDDDHALTVAVAHCLMHTERTGARACAASPEGEEVERLLARVARTTPMNLFADFPRRVRRCPHFAETLGRLRWEPATQARLEEIAGV